jgi:ribosomal protection tetracycline resistance protein
MPRIFHNIGILAHVDAGKTTLTEQMLFLMGAVRRAGSVDDGTAATDNLSVERRRGISVRTSTASAEWKGVTVNIIDTPGHVDFAGEVERSLAALDYAVVVVSAVEGVRAHTENILHALDKAGLPRLVFINKADRAGADPEAVLGDLKRVTKQLLIPLSRADNVGSDAVSVSLLRGGAFDERVTETLADIDDEAADAFLSDTVLPHERAETLLRKYAADCAVTPVLTGSAKLGVGVGDLADFMTAYMPSADRRAVDGLSGIIFKIEHDKTMGKVSHIRLFGGRIANRDEVILTQPADPRRSNPAGEEDDAVALAEKPPVAEKVSQIRKFTGGRYTDAGEVEGGDIAALCGLPSAKAGQFVGSLELGESARLVTPFLRVKVTPADGDPEKVPPLAAALAELSDEEPYIDAKWENGQREITISTTGKIQLEVLDALIREQYGLAPSFSPPTVIYKETPSRAGFAYADYTMPKPCWAVVQFKFEPMPRGYGVSYHGRLKSNQCFYRYQTHIRTSFYQCLEQGLYGWEVTDFRCTLVGGQHHTIHTHPLDFFVCTPMAFMNGLRDLGSTVLEPLLKLRITADSSLTGKITGEILRMRGEYDAPLFFGDSAVTEAVVPVATSMEFPVKLASWSSGKAVMTSSFYGYRECGDGEEHVNPRRGVNPLDRSKWILWARGAYQLSIEDM